MAMTTPLSLLLFEARSTLLILVMSIILGLIMNASWPILLMIGQEVFPGGAGGSSGLAFGWGFIAAAGGNTLTGFLAESIGLRESFQILAFLPLLVAGLVLALPSGQRPATPTAARRVSRSIWGLRLLRRDR